MSNPLETVLAALEAHGHEPKPMGAGFCCKCPAHDDTNPSLNIREGDNGRALVYCFTGCTVDAICGAIGLQVSDLFPDDPSRRNGHASKPRPSVTVTTTPRKAARGAGFSDSDGRTFATADEAVAALERTIGRKSDLRYVYTDTTGKPVGEIVRWNKPSGKRGELFPVTRKPDGSGWILRKIPGLHPLYRLPDVLATLAGSRVYVCEGEKATDATRSLGLVVTTSAGGADRAKGSDWSPVAGREVVILVDHDHAGEGYGADVTRLCIAAGAKSVRIVRLIELWAGMPDGGDMADLLNHRGGDVDPIRVEVEALATRAEPESVTPAAPAAPTFKPFPVEVLPEPIRSFVTDGAKATGCDTSFVALPLLAAMAAAVGTTRRIELKPGWPEPPILWTAIIGKSGTTKTPAFKLALAEIRKAQAQAFKEHESTRADAETEQLQYEAKLNAWRQKAKGHGDPGEPPEKPSPAIARRYTVSDTTTEALAPILRDNPRGVLLARDELAGWLGSFDRYSKGGKGGADSAHWLSMHSGETMTIDRKTGIPPTIHVPTAAVCITGGIQPRILARAMGQEHHESGMMARVLFAMPPVKTKIWTEAHVDSALTMGMAVVFERLFALIHDTDEAGDECARVLQLTAGGKAIWIAFFNEHAKEQAELSDDLSAAWSKLEGYAARLALVVHLARWAACDPTLADPDQIDTVSIAAGIKLARWFGAEAKRVYAMLGESEDDRERRQLVEWIDRKGGTMTANDLAHGKREYRNDSAGADKALGELVADGWGEWVDLPPGPKGGPSTRRFRSCSGVTVTRTPESQAESDSCSDGDTQDPASEAGSGEP